MTKNKLLTKLILLTVMLVGGANVALADGSETWTTSEDASLTRTHFKVTLGGSATQQTSSSGNRIKFPKDYESTMKIEAVVAGETITGISFSWKSTPNGSPTKASVTTGTWTKTSKNYDTWTGNAMEVTFTFQDTKDVEIQAITVTYTTASSGPQDPTFTLSSSSIEVGGTATITGPSGLNFNADVKDGAATGIVSINDGTITGLAEGATTITVTSAATDDYNAYSKDFEITVTKKAAGLAYATTEVSKKVGDANFTNTLTNPNELTVTYSITTNGTGSSISDAGEVTVGTSAGTETVTATFAGNTEFAAGTATYTLTVAGLSDKCQLTKVVYSNSFDAFIKEGSDDGTVTAYYMKDENVPTITGVTVSEGATYAVSGNTLTVTAEDGTTTKDYNITVSEVTPYTAIGERTFDGTETSWIKTGYTYDSTRGWRFAKNADSDNRIPEGRTRIYFFVGNAQSVTLTNGGVTSDRAIKVYVNGVENNSITTIGKSTGSNNSITIPCNSDSYNMIAIVSNQTGGDGGFTKISLNAPVSVSATIASSGYTTFCSPYDLSFENVENLEAAYVVTASTSSSATLTKVTAVPAGTGVILKGTAGEEVSIPVAEYTGSGISNILVGTLNATPVETETVYVVSGGEFKLFAGTEIPAGKAYLPKSAIVGGNAPSLSFDFGGETTGLSEELRVNSEESVYYDLSGRRVAQPTKGVYIVNGKKVLVP